MMAPVRIPVPARVWVLLLCEAALLMTCYLLPGLLGYPEMDVFLFLFYEDGLSRLAFLVLSILLVIYFQDLYSQLHVHSRVQLTQQLLVVIGVAMESTKEAVKKFVAKHGITYPVVIGDYKSADQVGDIPGLPTSYLYDPTGKQVAGHTGIVTRAGLEEYIQDKSGK